MFCGHISLYLYLISFLSTGNPKGTAEILIFIVVVVLIVIYFYNRIVALRAVI